MSVSSLDLAPGICPVQGLTAGDNGVLFLNPGDITACNCLNVALVFGKGAGVRRARASWTRNALN